MAAGHLSEIFLSIQGEGIHIGRPQLFVRLAGCPLRCRYCDTPAALGTVPRYQVQVPDGSREEGPNPIEAGAVVVLMDRADPDRLARETAVTGGEPLHQPEFLVELLARVRPARRIYLETAGVHTAALEQVIEQVDVVAMDIKLPSVAGEGTLWQEHEAFLDVARRRDAIVKVVVSRCAKVDEVERAARLVAAADRRIPFVLQPQTARGRVEPAGAGTEAPALAKNGMEAPGAWIMRLVTASSGFLDDVRVIPQAHKLLGLP